MLHFKQGLNLLMSRQGTPIASGIYSMSKKAHGDALAAYRPAAYYAGCMSIMGLLIFLYIRFRQSKQLFARMWRGSINIKSTNSASRSVFTWYDFMRLMCQTKEEWCNWRHRLMSVRTSACNLETRGFNCFHTELQIAGMVNQDSRVGKSSTSTT